MRERKVKVNSIKNLFKFYKPNTIFASTNFIKCDLRNEQKDLTHFVPHSTLYMHYYRTQHLVDTQKYFL